MSYRIAAPDEYLAITGMGVRNEVKITKAAWVWPFQKCMRFSVQPQDYAMNLQAMTKEKLQFLLPVVFTVGPHVPATSDASVTGNYDDTDAPKIDPAEALMRYAVLLAESRDSKQSSASYLEQKIKSIVEGEVRVLVSSMTIEEIFSERELFKRRVHKNIQTELNKFGVYIFNANLKELKDAPNSIYFESLSRKAHEGATNQARIDVAEAQLRGNVGEAERRGMQEREIAKINATTAVLKTERDIEKAQAEAKLNTAQAELTRDVDIARIEAQRRIESKDEDLKREVEVKRAAAELERLRATDVVKASIQREAKQQAADAKAYEVVAEAKATFEKSQHLTDAGAYKTTTEARATAEADFSRVTKHTDAGAYNTRIDAEAQNFAAQQLAEAELARELKKAEGISAMADAYGKLATAFGGPAGLLQYMMIEKGTYVELAKANAEAVRGMQPKISVWNTGPSGQDDAAPLMTTINEQTGITLPEWQFGKLAATTNEVAIAQGKQTNGA
ncbi:unnamed protein product [Parascedosporium putredinis]|uniref:Band 7 domain-containing protein n=1 Tax=Parascedosporium putredinis TaxID=1442378 RepID=A0A9P1HCN2_9PEZI|nr:unnamed protein product [Parascedosporium putredinis]CAI8004978.1 unnamed protein product [Parascedosporium putredinis]